MENIILRQDLKEISNLVAPKSKVLDLGCGNGSLLAKLRSEKDVIGSGIELAQERIIKCTEKGVPVVQENLDDGLCQFKDNSFDYVILSKTLQSVQRPDHLLKDMVRVGKKAILSIINMGFYRLRLQLLFTGRMPESKTLPYHWYNTPNTHLGTIKDFQLLCSSLDIKIIREIPLNENSNSLTKFFPNLFATTSVFKVTKN
ncbi:MAG: methionine biosynthesis protein MetW [Victivallales bacterium]|nr:methionine biosynthesis protein MetW [Victivallales bacterium]MCF7888531.1 methionine biosynthesis protein MetW [Victivallales bacterium]